MTEQLELRPAEAKVFITDDVALLIGLLKGNGWMHRGELKARILKETGHEFTLKKIRDTVADSDGRILSGQLGYKYFDSTVPAEESSHAARWLMSQGKKMVKHGIQIQRRAHALVENPNLP